MLCKKFLTLMLLASISLTVASAAFSEQKQRELVVTSIVGAAPVSSPVPDLPTKYLRVGETLYPHTSWLMMKNSILEVKDSASGVAKAIKGPARITVEKDGIAIYGKEKLVFPKADRN